jgi:hypothetical protein
LKGKVYNRKPPNGRTKRKYSRGTANILAEQLQKVNQNLLRRCEKYLRVEEQHFQNLV